MKPLFMWAGGKSRVIKHYSEIFPGKISTYSEPFFGGGAMFIHVMERFQPNKVIINDINPDIMRIYEMIRDHRESFEECLKRYEEHYLKLSKPDRKLYYYEVRHSHAYDYQSMTTEQEAATLYFLMKTGFNGIYQINKNTNGRYGTPSGLLNQKTEIYDRAVVAWWHEALQGVEIRVGDWKQAVDTNGFVFMDPPYRDSFADYGHGFSDDQLKDLIAVGEACKDVLICNREGSDGFFEANRRSLKMKRFDIVYTAGRRKRVDGGHEAKRAVEVVLYKEHMDNVGRLPL